MSKGCTRYRCVVGVTLAVAACVCAAGQQAPTRFDFDKFTANYIGEFIVKEGEFLEWTDGVDVVLQPDDPEMKPLRLRAREFHFTYASEGAVRVLALITMLGEVVINYPEIGEMSAGRAEWDQRTGLIALTEHPQALLKSAGGAPIKGEKIVLNPDEGLFRVVKLTDSEIDLSAMRAASKKEIDPSLLAVADVRDFTGLVAKVQADAAAEKPSPGKRLVSLLADDARTFFLSMTAQQAADPGLQARIAKEFNRVLVRRDFYTAESWQGIELGSEAKALLAQGVDALEPSKVTRLNRLLFQAAYANHFAPPAAQ